ncbi:vascular cell adhesion protein 1-like isoform X2 [Sphaeramia orbicularis]|nr:vascular cell adhesion protein 1-like isoform X2 [Sphaeramia orbicularis]XP_029978672.1 vascular cell adhesion protein 1-like isoform X2 [Sphaeramia orbicularis]
MGTFLLLILLFCSDVLPACIPDLHLTITAPGEIKALSGSCVQIPCKFSSRSPNEDFNNTRPHFGIWLKTNTNNNNAVFNSSGINTNKLNYPMTITGDLSHRDCTTLFYDLTKDYDDRYFFRIQNLPFIATASCDPVKITIEDSPPSPRIEVSPQQLKEKESVTITCSALTPCPHSPPKLTWNLQQDAANNMEVNPDRTLTTKIQQIITVSDQHDGYNISCSAAYPVDEGRIKTAETNITLSVSYAPKNTSASISPSGSLWAGMWVNLTCSSRAKPPVSNFTWFKTSTHGPIRVSEGDVYSFSLTDDTDGDYYCEATNDLGKQNSSLIHTNIEGNADFWLFIYNRVKICEIVLLISTLIVFECWFRSRYSNKPVQVQPTVEPDYVNTVFEGQE